MGAELAGMGPRTHVVVTSPVVPREPVSRQLHKIREQPLHVAIAGEARALPSAPTGPATHVTGGQLHVMEAAGTPHGVAEAVEGRS